MIQRWLHLLCAGRWNEREEGVFAAQAFVFLSHPENVVVCLIVYCFCCFLLLFPSSFCFFGRSTLFCWQCLSHLLFGMVMVNHHSIIVDGDNLWMNHHFRKSIVIMMGQIDADSYAKAQSNPQVSWYYQLHRYKWMTSHRVIGILSLNMPIMTIHLVIGTTMPCSSLFSTVSSSFALMEMANHCRYCYYYHWYSLSLVKIPVAHFCIIFPPVLQHRAPPLLLHCFQRLSPAMRSSRKVEM